MASTNPPPQSHPIISNGRPVDCRPRGIRWHIDADAIEVHGPRDVVTAGKMVGENDFHLRAKLTLRKGARTPILTVRSLRGSLPGFRGGPPHPSAQMANSCLHWVLPEELCLPDRPFAFEIYRRGDQVIGLIDGNRILDQTVTELRLGEFGFTTLCGSLGIHDFSITGELSDAPHPSCCQRGYTIPTIDLSTETERVVIIDRKAGHYIGHPTTLLMPDGKTMFCTYPLGHGGPEVILKKSTDGGLTWSDRLPVPENWGTGTNCPCIHRLVGPDGVARLLIVEGSGPKTDGKMRQSISVDDGETWTPLEENGLSCIVAPITIIPISENRHLAHYHQGHGPGSRGTPLAIWQAISKDGGISWQDERLVGEYPGAHPCEPALIRSPDGRSIASISRENTRVYNSMIQFSEDEGETWSEMREVPAALTGDRHMPRYTGDGRLIIAFRDTAQDSPTKGDFVAWIGTFDDLLEGKEGQYRIRLFNSPIKGDLGYPGVECLPDGTIAATTYAVFSPEDVMVSKNGRHAHCESVISVRFHPDELDRKHREQVQATSRRAGHSDLFVSGTDGYHTFRLPALVVAPDGDLLAICEGRRKGPGDHGDLSLVFKRSTNNGEAWGPLQYIYGESTEDRDVTIGNPCPVVDRETGTIWLPFCRENVDVLMTRSDDNGHTWSDPVDITAQVKEPEWDWYATGPGNGIQIEEGPYRGRLVIPCDHDELRNGRRIMCSQAIFSDDHGDTWTLGRTIGPHTDECQVVELPGGTLMMNIRNYWGRTGNRPDLASCREIAYSEDGGETWQDIRFDNTLIEPLCQASIIKHTGESGKSAGEGSPLLVYSNPADQSERCRMTVRLSRDQGRTWFAEKLVHEGPSAYSSLVSLPDGSIGLLFEGGDHHRREWLRFLRFTTDSINLDSGSDSIGTSVANGECRQFVDRGRPTGVASPIPWWHIDDGFVEVNRNADAIIADRAIGPGDFDISAQLRLPPETRNDKPVFLLNASGVKDGFTRPAYFDPRRDPPGELRRFHRLTIPSDTLGTPGVTFEVCRRGSEVIFKLGGELFHRIDYGEGAFGEFGISVDSGGIRVSEFRATGNLTTVPHPPSRSGRVSLSTIDLSDDRRRQVIVDRRPGYYIGHPHTLLMPDHRTIFSVYPIGHGGPTLLKRSDDGGLTWSDCIPTSKNWEDTRNAPTIHRLVAPDGKARLFVFQQTDLAMWQAVSEDDGKTWAPFEPNGLECVVPPISVLPVKGNRYLMQYHQQDRASGRLTVWQSLSADGGLTWTDTRMVGTKEGAAPCEPAIIRSPDGSQLASISRENARRYNSLLMVSDDDGESWSELVELPASLTGDRHMPRYAHDGRLVMVFRDTAFDSPTPGDFVGWVGTYDDLVNGREGQYRFRLFNSPAKGDLGYPGLELLPDGTFVATTYAVYDKADCGPNEFPLHSRGRHRHCTSDISFRFSLEELDAKNGK